MALDAMSEMPPPSAPDESGALDAFICKWRARWPEWSVVEVFVSQPHRPVALAWAALQQELTDAAWGGSDARPGEAKLLWWQEELQGWALGRRRHPLGASLQRLPAPWVGLAAALPTLRDSRERPGDADEAFAQMMPLAMAAAAIEQALFAGAQADASIARLVSATWLQARLARDGAAAVPLSVLARIGENNGDRDAEASWRDELLREWPAAGRATRPRRLWAALARARLTRGPVVQPLAAWVALWVAWRGARN